MSLSKGLRALRSLGSFSEKGGTSNSSRMDVADSLDYLISHEYWDEVRILLSNPDTATTSAAIQSCQYGYEARESGNNALHFTCRFYPPWDVIKSIDRICPQYLNQVDKNGRTALHIAAKSGVSPQVIRYLCAKDPESAGAQDVSGRTPLHYACKYYCVRYSASKCDNVPLLDSMRDVIRTLCRTAPKSVNLEDADGCGALEYAIEFDAPFKIVRDIQKACEKDWKKRRSSSGGLSHASLAKDLQDQAHAQQNRLHLEIMKLTDSSMSIQEERDTKADSTLKETLFPSSGQQVQVMLSSRRQTPSGAKRALCA